jgi:uncharacterized pyridoxal phosphate-containing UPF0001 family protein
VKLNQALVERGKHLTVLLEVNVGGEESKFGWRGSNALEWKNMLADFKQVTDLPNLAVLGLMTMPPLFDEPDLSRPYFKMLRELRQFLTTELPKAAWQELSMGTSSDFETAIGEGATIIRVGRAILGSRPERKADSLGEHS